MAMRRYIVHCADGDVPRTRWVEGVTVEDAALAFLLDWEPDGRQEVIGLIVCHAASGEEQNVSIRPRPREAVHA